MDLQLLRDLGLKDNEIAIYLYLLGRESAKAEEVSRGASLTRTHTYDVLNSLIKKGFVSQLLRGNRKTYSAAPPDKITNFFLERKEKIDELVNELKQLHKGKAELPLVSVYEGIDGLKTILNDILRTKPEEWLVISSGTAKRVLPYFMDIFERKRVSLRIKMRVIFDKSKDAITRGKELLQYDLTKVRYLSPEIIANAHLYVYENKTAILMFEEDASFAILISHSAVANRFKRYFEYLWKISAK